MKRLFAPLLVLALALAACSAQPQTPAPQPEPEPIPFSFTRENLPRLDGSTSTVPLAQSICAVLLGEDVEEVTDLIQFSRTTQSYRNLMAGQADLLLAAEPAPEVLAELEAGGEWLLTPFATDALVFVVNADNPVSTLTTQQVQQIYTGEITNWSQVGGSDLEIIPFQRNDEAGSQTMFEKLVMADLPLMEPPSQWISDSMSGLLEAVREYDNSPAAIGYTVYYYANDMEMAKGLKVLSIDGVAPSADAIRAGEYPFLNPYYVSIRQDAAADSPTRILYDWVLSADGQELVAREGYVPVLETEGYA
ncbi:MAG: substrate-binding domain-containing protein [Clostridium sp.]|nr:substrate-binding domain-containing protein [Clostridium sp.]